MKGIGAKRNVCPGSCVSTGAKFPVAPVESAPMWRARGRDVQCIGLDPQRRIDGSILAKHGVKSSIC